MAEERYSRQVGFLGRRGQKAVEDTRVVVVGCGALGNAASSLLVSMNFKRVRFLDDDKVEESNLPRCSFFDHADVGKKKTDVLEKKFKRIGSDTIIESIPERVSEKNLLYLEGCDLIIDCTDSMEARRIINKFSVKRKLPWVYGALTEDEGFVASFSGRSPCFECLYSEGKAPTNEDSANRRISSPLPSIIGSLQTSQATKIVAGQDPGYGKLYHLSLKDMEMKTSKFRKDPHCKICSGRD